MGNQQTAASQQIGALHQEIDGIENYLRQMQNQQQFTSQPERGRSVCGHASEN